MKYYLHPLIGTEYDETAPLFLLRSEGDTSIIIGHEDIPEIAKITSSYVKDGSHDGALSWPEYKPVGRPAKLTTITEVLEKAEKKGIETPTDRAIRKWIAEGKLDAQKVGRAWQFEENEFFALIEAWEARITDADDASLGGLYGPEDVPIFPLRPECELLVFDLDGTLADSYSDVLYEHMQHWFDWWHKRGKLPHIAIATNQGGPACLDAKFGDFYPSFEQVEARLNEIQKQLPPQTLINACYAFPDRDGNIRLPNALAADDQRASIEWRKPAPGMILDACEHFKVNEPWKIWMVGDRDSDKEAAQHAGVNFLRVKEGRVVPEERRGKIAKPGEIRKDG